MAAKNFVFAISRNFNFMFSEIFLEFREISRHAKSKVGRNFLNFAKHEIKIVSLFFPFCMKRDDFLLGFQKDVKNYFVLVHINHEI